MSIIILVNNKTFEKERKTCQLKEIKNEPAVDDVARVGLAVASGEMKYEDLLEWIIDNKKF